MPGTFRFLSPHAPQRDFVDSPSVPHTLHLDSHTLLSWKYSRREDSWQAKSAAQQPPNHLPKQAPLVLLFPAPRSTPDLSQNKLLLLPCRSPPWCAQEPLPAAPKVTPAAAQKPAELMAEGMLIVYQMRPRGGLN